MEPALDRIVGASIIEAQNREVFHDGPLTQDQIQKLLRGFGEHPAAFGMVVGVALASVLALADWFLMPVLPEHGSGLVWFQYAVLVPACSLIFSAAGAIIRKSGRTLVSRLEERVSRFQKLQEVSLIGLAKVSDAREPSSAGHVNRMGRVARMLAENLSLTPKYASYITPQYIRDIGFAAPLHDIGKVGISDSILRKKGSLSPDEFELMKMHTIIGGGLMGELEKQLPYQTFFTLGKEIAYHHHQKWDGTGYPNVLGKRERGKDPVFMVQDGVGMPLSGEEIPLSARIVAVADVYDALVSKRIYKDAFKHEKARDTIVAESGHHFDPDVVQAFLNVEEDILNLQKGGKD